MSDIRAFDMDALDLRTPDTMPRQGFHICVLASASGTRPERLIPLRASEDGFRALDGSELSNAWHVRAWVANGEGIELMAPAAMTATIRKLQWRVDKAGGATAQDGLGGTYFFDPARGRLTFENSDARILRATPETYAQIAQDHFETRVRSALR